MLATLAGGVGGKLAERWAAAIFTPAFAFWTGGFVASLWASGALRAWRGFEPWLRAQPGIVHGALAVGVLLLIATSGIIVRQLTLPVLRLLEGYWPWPLAAMRRLLVRRVKVRVAVRQARWEALAARIDEGIASNEERDEQRDLELWLREYPATAGRLMPTRLGNILRGAESWPGDKYGLDAVKVWPAFWIILPESTRAELADARTRLDSAATSWLWGALFAIWTPWAWWALAIAALVTTASYYVWVLSAARSYGRLIEGAFDVHRTALYSALRWPLPATPAAERTSGQAVTRYLWRGSDEPDPTFVAPADSRRDAQCSGEERKNGSRP
jgi:hypothetical protein